MAVNKVVYGNQTLIDLSTDTVASADDILLGKVGHLRDGSVVTGTASGGDPHGTIWQDGQGYVHLDDESGIALQSKSVTPSESQQIVEAGEGYYALDKVTVGAISSSYVGSGVTRRSSSDLSASGATVTAPAGYYETSASKSVASGTAGTPTATKSAVSNHAVTVTPSVTNTTGYITGSTKTGTAVSVSASELVSGTYNVTSSGTKDVTNYASASVPAGTAGTPTATKGTVSNHAVTVTPSVTNTTGYISGGTKTGTGISVSASELVSGTYSVTSSGTKDVTNYASASVPAGTEGTPTATKGSVSNHSVSVTPSVTNTGGYIAGSTKTGTAVTVSASELVSGTKSITQNGTGIDVSTYASVDVNISSVFEVRMTVSGSDPNITLTPNKTFAEAKSVLDAGGELRILDSNGNALGCTYQYYPSTNPPKIMLSYYRIRPNLDQFSYVYYYNWTSTGIAYIAHEVMVEEPTLITKNITANGTYNASSDSADGYSSVTVNVTSVPSVVTGTFTTNSANAGTAVDISIPYTGNGYPIDLMIDVDGGIDGNTTYASLIDKYSIARASFSKEYYSQTPTYASSGTENLFRHQYLYKSSDSSATSYSGSNSTSFLTSSSNPTASASNFMRMKSATTLSVFVKASSYGFSTGITYRYLILYSS